jgi:hypothetical protein
VQEPPQITITDPGNPGAPADLLVAGDERPRRQLPRRVPLIGVVLALVVTGTVVGINRYREHQAAVRKAAAAFALADTVHARITLAEGGVYAEPPLEIVEGDGTTSDQRGVQPLPGLGRLVVPLTVSDDADVLTEIRGVRVTGEGITTEFDTTSLAGRVPGGSSPFGVPVTFQCSEAAAGHYPSLKSVVVLLVPESGREHRVTLPLNLRPAVALEACGLPDPAALPETSIEEQHGRLLVTVTSVPRSRLPLQVLTITSPGFAMALVGGVPGRPAGLVPINTGVIYDVRVRVTDCVAALAGSGKVTLTLREGKRHWTLVAPDSPAADFRRPGSTWLRLAAERACPNRS